MSRQEDLENIQKELSAYISEIKSHFPELIKEPEDEGETNKSSFTVPHQEVFHEDDEMKDKNIIDADEGGPYPVTEPDDSQMHYRSDLPATPYVDIKVLEQALQAIEELKNLLKEQSSFIVTYIDDTGDRRIYRAPSADKAQSYIDMFTARYIRNTDPPVNNGEIYVDEGTGEGIYEATPIDYLRDDESLRGEAEVEHKLHTHRDDKSSVVYNEKTGRTARWDLYDLNDAAMIDAHEEFHITEEEIEQILQEKKEKTKKRSILKKKK